ncbi:hypothetical protein GCM10022226_21270 [Sphaerisporangium flaviroseum]|uniref:Uncharacterized protein n=1 Tax=Sphaerisporangium flaviroseum TaxID=509199 RepID=A0ABP7HRI8_9ACTN
MRGFKAAVVLAMAGMLMLPAPAEAGTDVRAGVTAVRQAGSEQALRTPASVAKKLFKAWLGRDRRAAAAVATPAAVKTLFAYVYRAPDRFGGCSGNACRFVHTSVRVPGALNGILMIVSGGTVTKVYQSRHLTTAGKAARHLFGAWKAGDRNRGLEVASAGAVKRLFRTRFGGVRYYYQGCVPEKGGRSCAYSYEGGAMLMHARGSATRGYEVRSISYIAD